MTRSITFLFTYISIIRTAEKSTFINGYQDIDATITSSPSLCGGPSLVEVTLGNSDMDYAYQWSRYGTEELLNLDFSQTSPSVVPNLAQNNFALKKGNAGVNDYLSIGLNNQDHLQIPKEVFDGLEDFEFSCDFWLDATNSGLNTILSIANSIYDNDFLLSYTSSQNFIIITKNGIDYFGSNLNLTANTWHTISVSRIGSELNVNLNGLDLGTKSCSSIPLNSEYVSLGQEQDGVGGPFDINQALNGRLDNVILKRILPSNSSSISKLAAGPVHVMVTDTNGCQTTLSSYVNEIDIELVEKRVIICENDSFVYQSNIMSDFDNSYKNVELSLIQDITLDYTIPHDISIPTVVGESYFVMANGVFTVWNGCEYLDSKTQYFDPSFSYLNSVTNNRNLFYGSYNQSRPITDVPSSDNSYYYKLVGTGNDIRFKYSDNNFNQDCQCYADNCGFINVQVYKIENTILNWSNGASGYQTVLYASDSMIVADLLTPSYECADTVFIEEIVLFTQDSILACLGDTVILSTNEIGKSLSIDQDNNYIEIPNSTSLQITGDLTIEMWLKPKDFSQRRNPINKAYGGEYTITQEPSGSIAFYWGTSGTNAQPHADIHSNGHLELNKWTHVAIVRDLTSGVHRWYINGELDRTTNTPFAVATPSMKNVLIGEGYVHGYNGNINEVRIWNTALSQSTIQDWKNKTINATHPSYSNLMLYHKLDILKDGISLDASSLHNDGYVVGNPLLSKDISNISNNDIIWYDNTTGSNIIVNNVTEQYYKAT